MKRPFAVIGFTYLSALLAAMYIGPEACAAAAVILVAAAVAAGIGFGRYAAKKAVVAALISAAAGMAAYGAMFVFAYQPAAALSGRTAAVEGVVVEEPSQSGSSWSYIVSADKITVSGRDTGVKCRLKLTAFTHVYAEPFDRISFIAQVSSADSSETGFDSGRYYRSKGIYLTAKTPANVKVTASESRPPYYYAIMLRRMISSTIYKYVPGERGGLTAGILIGDTRQIPAQTRNDFRLTGISHILAVSGTQTSLITEYILLLLCALGIRKKPAAIFSAAAVTGYMAITGFSPSVMRAGIMSLLFLAAILVDRQTDALNSLGISVLVLCAVNPFAAADVGLLLSFTATLGMVTVSSQMIKGLDTGLAKLPGPASKLLGPPARLMCETFGATVFTLPVIALTFGQISLVTFLSNILEVPVSLFVTIMSALMVLIEPLRIFTPVINALAMLIRLAVTFMMWYAHLLASLPYAAVSARNAVVAAVLICAASAAIFYFVLRRRGKSFAICTLCVCLAVSVCAGAYEYYDYTTLTIAAMPAQTGSSTVVVSRGKTLIYDLDGSETSYLTAQYLKSRGISRVDALVLPVYDKERVKYVNSLLDTVEISHIYIPGAYKSDENPLAECVEAPGEIRVGAVSMYLLPDNKGTSLLGLMSYGGYTAAFTYGADADTVKYGVEAASLRSETAFVGAGVSDAFAKAVHPEVAITSGKKSAAGGTVFRKIGCKVYDTYACGTVTIRARSDGSYKTIINSSK
jgi:competence protein ComEC